MEVFCREHKLFIEKSRFKVALDDTEQFTNRGKISEDGMVFVYISKDELRSAQACLFETVGDHQNLGLLLGYPECCVRFFSEQFKNGNLNPVHQPLNPWTNLTKREHDACFISHFPCKSDCEGSVSIAQMNVELLRKTDEKVERVDQTVLVELEDLVQIKRSRLEDLERDAQRYRAIRNLIDESKQ